MNPRVRRLLIRAAATTAVACATSLAVLRSGRPVYYTDGDSTYSARDLRDAPMRCWGRPEPRAELPGPVVGRVARLPDGRLLYGRGVEGEGSDLVSFDPARPDLDPVPARALNSPGHDLAPALGPDGLLYFASDRRGGRGGFDLYRARIVAGGFGLPEPLPENVNSAADETDPAPHPAGSELVFVRRVAELDGGRNGRLWRARLDGDRPAVPVWDDDEAAGAIRAGRVELVRIDRDPAWAADGVALWFVRQLEGGVPQVHSTWHHRGAFADPVRQPGLDRGGPFRSPLPDPAGRAIELLRTATAAVVYEAHAFEVYPHWPGQHALEYGLFLALLASLLVLLLLVLGKRWRQLDIVTWCILASLLLHFLLLLWLAGVELVRGMGPELGADERIAVRLVRADGAAGRGDAGPAQAHDALAARQRFSPHRDAVAVAVPPSAVGGESAAPAPAAAQRRTPDPAPRAVVGAPALEDAAAEPARRAGADGLAAAAAVTTAVDQAVARAEPSRAAEESAAFEVAVPGAGLPTEAPRVGGSAPSAERVVAAPEPAAVAAAQPLADTPAATARRAAAEAVADSAAVASGAPAGAVPAPRAVERPAAADGPANPSAAPESVGALPGAARSVPAAARLAELAPRPWVVEPELGDAVPAAALPARRGVADEAAAPAVAAELGEAAAEVAEVAPVRAAAGADAMALTAAPSSALEPAQRTGAASRRRDALATAAPRRAATAPALRDAVGAPHSARTAAERVAASSAAAAPELAPADPAGVARRSERAVRPGSDVAVPIASALDAAPRSEPSALRLAGPQPRPRSGPGPREVLRDVPVAAVATPAPAATAPAPARSAPLARAVAEPTPAPAPRPVRAARSHRDAGTERAVALPPSFVAAGPRTRAPAPAQGPAIASLYGNRFGAAKAAALERFGGTAETERAVAAGLRYLASVQQRRGNWGRRARDHEKYGDTRVGKTALCVLAFLGAGHTHRSDTEYSDHVARAIAYLLAAQDERTGHFGRRTSAYSHGISTYALAECMALTRDERLRPALERAVAWILRQQAASRDPRTTGGWGYFSPTLEPEDPYARTSVTAWMVMALESARLSDIEVPDAAIDGARRFLRGMFDRSNGYFLYNKEPERLSGRWRTLPASTPAAVFCLLLTGTDRDDSRIRAALDYVIERRPRRYREASDDGFVMRGEGNVYFWYYSSLAAFLAGGEAWDQWNVALRTVLPSAQNPDGSFTPVGAYAEYADDRRGDYSYTTAMVVLSLEVYYRYFTPLLEQR